MYVATNTAKTAIMMFAMIKRLVPIVSRYVMLSLPFSINSLLAYV
jgi:hypothetical protein